MALSRLFTTSDRTASVVGEALADVVAVTASAVVVEEISGDGAVAAVISEADEDVVALQASRPTVERPLPARDDLVWQKEVLVEVF